MDMPFADMHVHTFYSDGSMSPEEVVNAAVLNRVGLLAVADHNTLEGNRIARELCKDKGIKFLSAVEIDAVDTVDSVSCYHVLAYGFDINDKEFNNFLDRVRSIMDGLGVKLINNMKPDYPDISVEEYEDFKYENKFGGWKALYYIMHKGLAGSIMEALKIQRRYVTPFKDCGLYSVSEVVRKIKEHGGYAILAHPGEKLRTDNIETFMEKVKHAISLGFDGLECYYTTHSREETKICLKLCEEYDLMVTGGTDCHGAFGYKTRVGALNVRINTLKLKDLLNRCSK